MSYKSKRTIVSMIVGAILIIAYIIYAFGDHSPAPDDLKAWAIAMLVCIGIGVTAVIVILILFHIAFAIGLAAKEHAQGRSPDENVEREMSSQMVEDEMDKLIAFKAQRVGHWFGGLGFVAALVALVFGMPVVSALHIPFGAAAVGSCMEGVMSIYFYERGVHNG
jgi:hypothetical protein